MRPRQRARTGLREGYRRRGVRSGAGTSIGADVPAAREEREQNGDGRARGPICAASPTA
jgi:hypothetical protein